MTRSTRSTRPPAGRMPRLLEGRLESFYAVGVEQFQMAGARAGLVEHTLRFGDRRVGLRFAGRALADALIGPFTRRTDVHGGALDARIDLWAAGEYRVPWAMADIGPAGLVRGSDPGGVVAVHETGSGAVTLVDVGARAIQYRVRSAEGVPWWERAAPLRAALMPETIRDSLSVRGVVVPRIRGGATGVRPLGGAEALLALGPSTVLQTPFDDVGVLRSLADLARQLPCFALDVGDEVAAVARAVDRILAELTP